MSFFTDVSSEMIYPLLPVFLSASLGASASFIGAIEGAAESTAAFLKLASGWWSDRVRRRKPLVVAGYALASLARPLIAVAQSAAQVLAIRVTDRVGKGIRTSPRDALLADSVSPDIRGRAFGFHRAADHAGAVVGPLIAFAVLRWEHVPLRWVFAAAAVPGVIAVLVLALAVREAPRETARGRFGARRSSATSSDAARGAPPEMHDARERRDARHQSGAPGADPATPAAIHPPRARGAGAHDAGAHAVPAGGGSWARAEGGPVPNEGGRVARAAGGSPVGAGTRSPLALGRRFWAYLGVLFVFTLGNSTDAFLLLRASQLGVVTALAPILWAMLHVVKSASSTPGGALSDRLGRRPLIIAGWLLYAGVYFAFGRATEAWHAWALFALYGVYFGLTEGVEKALVADLVPRERRGAAFGWYNLAVGLGALPASIIFGTIWDRAGAPAAFGFGATMALVAALGLTVVLPRAAAQQQRAPGRL